MEIFEQDFQFIWQTIFIFNIYVCNKPSVNYKMLYSSLCTLKSKDHLEGKEALQWWWILVSKRKKTQIFFSDDIFFNNLPKLSFSSKPKSMNCSPPPWRCTVLAINLTSRSLLGLLRANVSTGTSQSRNITDGSQLSRTASHCSASVQTRIRNLAVPLFSR